MHTPATNMMERQCGWDTSEANGRSNNKEEMLKKSLALIHTHCANEPRNLFCAHIQADRDDACRKRGKWEWDDNWTNSVDMYRFLSFGRSASRVCVHVCRTVTTTRKTAIHTWYALPYTAINLEKTKKKYTRICLWMCARDTGIELWACLYIFISSLLSRKWFDGHELSCECVRTCCDCCARAVYTFGNLGTVFLSALRFAVSSFFLTLFCRFSGCVRLCLQQFT